MLLLCPVVNSHMSRLNPINPLPLGTLCAYRRLLKSLAGLTAFFHYYSSIVCAYICVCVSLVVLVLQHLSCALSSSAVSVCACFFHGCHACHYISLPLCCIYHLALFCSGTSVSKRVTLCGQLKCPPWSLAKHNTGCMYLPSLATSCVDTSGHLWEV